MINLSLLLTFQYIKNESYFLLEISLVLKILAKKNVQKG